ncbi:hypothetical protein CICLE_v10010123mg [Citrus x clementina]|uniref:Uncharacterized protein n=1 Tax=Citrus clementina TaxID=85681 RepID=V4UFS5_CITCL|nr:hypothetical protein CICLE_v10010123mg [Citrus x clementina]
MLFRKKKKSLNFATLVNFTALQAVSSHNSMKSTSVFLSFNLYHFAASFFFFFLVQLLQSVFGKSFLK